MGVECTPIPPAPPETLQALREAQFRARLFTECFYYTAWRVVVICTKTAAMPGFSGFAPEGVRMVRNALLEHAGEKRFPITIQSFGMGGPVGPALKPARWDHQVGVHVDKGLHVNAEEFRDKFERRLRAALGRAS